MNATLNDHLEYLKLAYFLEQYNPLAAEASHGKWSHVDYPARLAEGQAKLKRDRSIERRICLARFPVIKTIDACNWSWPKSLNRLQVQNLLRLKFIEAKGNVIFLGGVGLGKTHLATSLGYAACLKGHSVLFSTAVDAINTLSAAQQHGTLKKQLGK